MTNFETCECGCKKFPLLKEFYGKNYYLPINKRPIRVYTNIPDCIGLPKPNYWYLWTYEKRTIQYNKYKNSLSNRFYKFKRKNIFKKRIRNTNYNTIYRQLYSQAPPPPPRTPPPPPRTPPLPSRALPPLPLHPPRIPPLLLSKVPIIKSKYSHLPKAPRA